MTIGLILKRMRREWRSLAILLLAVCLLTGFFALGPFYIRAVTEVGLRFELDSAPPESLQVNLILDDEPLSQDALDVVREELGALAVDYEHYIRADYNPPTTEGGIDNPGLATGGFIYSYGEPVGWATPRLIRTFQPFAFDNMPQLLELVEGRWPRRLPPPDVVDPTGLSDAEQQARQIGPYTRGEVEIVISSIVAEEANLELGSRFVVGNVKRDGTLSAATVVVVGIVEPKNSDDPFWRGNRNFIEGAHVEYGLGLFRYDFGFATLPEAYTDWLRDVTPGNAYVYTIKTDPDVITAGNIQAYKDRLAVLQNRLNAYHPGLSVLSGLASILEGYSGDVSDTEGPIILLSGAILVMLLYHLVNTVALVLEQQGTEWSSIVSRGGSVPQLVIMQLATVGVLGVVGALAGPLLSVVFMRVMEHFGPLAVALGGESLGATRIPAISVYLAVGAAVASVLVLTLPALPAARRSLLRLKQRTSRPPTRPVWARYSLDAVITLVGLGFMLRLYYLVGGDFGNLLNNVLAAPRDVVKLIADNLNQTGGLNDPFNLLGPALVLTGLALVWLRLFPLLMDAISGLFTNSRHLTTPLAVWNVARDPGHYAQLVLLLIGTLALGTASLGLSETRDKGAWRAAREETGDAARIEIAPEQVDPSAVRWGDLPGVSEAVGLLHVVGDPGSSIQRNVHLFGVRPEQVPGSFGTLGSAVQPLAGVPVPPPPGLALPGNAVKLQAQVYALPQANPDDPPVTVKLTAYLQDALGVPFRVQLSPPSVEMRSDVPAAPGERGDIPTPVEEWLTFEGTLPDGGNMPYRLMRIGVNSTAGNLDAFEHTLYLDRIATQDVFGTTTAIESFEDGANAWAGATVSNPYAASWVASTSGVSRVGGIEPVAVTGETPEIDGATALKLHYLMGKTGGRRREPSVVVNEPHLDRLPVVINRTFAEDFKGRSISNDPLEVGDERNLVLNVGTGSVELGYRVVGVIDDIPSVDAKAPVMITQLDLVRPVINQAATATDFFDQNEIWLALPDREPSAALERAVADIGGVENVVWAWDRYGEIQREPLPSAVAGMLFAGFWISLLLSLLDFAFYLVVTARQRLFTFGVLRSLGWNSGHIWRLLFIEQVALITPALIIGSMIGAALAYLLLPFLALVGQEPLRIPWLQLAAMLAILALSFTALMGIAAIFLRRMSVNQVLRLGEE